MWSPAVERRPSLSATTLATSAARSKPKRKVGHALGDAAVEQTGGSGHDHQHRDRCGARRFAEDGDVVLIAAESGDVVVHPLKRSDLVEQSPVGHCAGYQHETFTGHAVVEADDYHTARRQPASVAIGFVRRAGGEPATVEPHHDRQGRCTHIRSPHVHGQPLVGRCEAHRLRWRRSELVRIEYAIPRFVGHRCGEAQRADRRLCVRDSAEGMHAVLQGSPNLPCLRRDDCHSTMVAGVRISCWE